MDKILRGDFIYDKISAGMQEISVGKVNHAIVNFNIKRFFKEHIAIVFINSIHANQCC